MTKRIDHLTFFLASLEGGGIQIATIRLIRELIRRNIRVSLVVINSAGPIRKEIPDGCVLVDLNCHRTRFAFFVLLKYLRRERPVIGISSQTHLNVLMIILRFLCRYPKKLIVREHNTFNEENIKAGNLLARSRVWLIRLFYPFASKFVAVSDNVANSIKNYAKYPKDILVIWNGIDFNEIDRLKSFPINYPWFSKNRNKKLIVGMGRLSRQKNFSDLLIAFSRIKAQTSTRLIIMGEGVELESLQALSRKLQIQDKLDFPGFVDNPYSVVAQADVFVLSSRWEGFSNVILEALACGVPIVANDCPGGPADILEGQSFARIVPLGDPNAMANSISELLWEKINKSQIINFAQQFNIKMVAQQYLDMIRELL